jgi:hypothetical protein
MNRELKISRKIQVKKSPIEGFGVFATEDIEADEILEEVPFILFPKYTSLGRAFHDFCNQVGYCASKNKFYESLRQNLAFKDPEKYYFTWTPPQPDFNGEKMSFQVLPLGLGCIYNTCNTRNNAGWKVERDTFIFHTVKPIKAGDEIRTFYGYFVDDSSRNWNTDLMFYLGVDKINDHPMLSALKFNSGEAYEAKKKDPGYHKIFSLLDKYQDLKFERISAISPFGQEGLVNEDIKNYKTSAKIYETLYTYKTSNASKIKFLFSNTKNQDVDEVVIDK